MKPNLVNYNCSTSKNINTLKEYHPIDLPELISTLQLDVTWPGKINAAADQTIIDDKSKYLSAGKIVEEDKTNHAKFFRAVLNDVANRNIAAENTSSVHKKSGGSS